MSKHSFPLFETALLAMSKEAAEQNTGDLKSDFARLGVYSRPPFKLDEKDFDDFSRVNGSVFGRPDATAGDRAARLFLARLFDAEVMQDGSGSKYRTLRETDPRRYNLGLLGSASPATSDAIDAKLNNTFSPKSLQLARDAEKPVLGINPYTLQPPGDKSLASFDAAADSLPKLLPFQSSADVRRKNDELVNVAQGSKLPKREELPRSTVADRSDLTPPDAPPTSPGMLDSIKNWASANKDGLMLGAGIGIPALALMAYASRKRKKKDDEHTKMGADKLLSEGDGIAGISDENSDKADFLRLLAQVQNGGFKGDIRGRKEELGVTPLPPFVQRDPQTVRTHGSFESFNAKDPAMTAATPFKEPSDKLKAKVDATVRRVMQKNFEPTMFDTLVKKLQEAGTWAANNKTMLGAGIGIPALALMAYASRKRKKEDEEERARLATA